MTCRGSPRSSRRKPRSAWESRKAGSPIFDSNARDPGLRAAVQRGLGHQVEPVQVVELRHVQQRQQPRPHRVGGLALDVVGAPLARVGRLDDELLLERRFQQFGRDDGLAAQHGQVVVGAFLQRIALGIQIGSGTPLRQQQAEHLLVGQRLRLEVGLVIGGGTQQPVDLVEVGAVPGFDAVAQPDHLAVSGHRAQRQGIDVVGDDALPRLHRLLAVQVGAQRGGGDLPELLAHGRRAALGRMAVLLHLRGQRAAAGHALLGVQLLDAQLQDRTRQPVPLHRRVAVRVARVQQFAVLDEQQGLHDQVGNRRKRGVGAGRTARIVDGLFVVGHQHQAGTRLLPIDREQAPVGDVAHALGPARLGLDGKAARGGRGDEGGDLRVSVADVVGAVFGKADGIAGPGLHCPGQFAGQLADVARLLARGLDLSRGKDHHGDHQQQEDADEQASDESRSPVEAGAGKRGHGAPLPVNPASHPTTEYTPAVSSV